MGNYLSSSTTPSKETMVDTIVQPSTTAEVSATPAVPVEVTPSVPVEKENPMMESEYINVSEKDGHQEESQEKKEDNAEVKYVGPSSLAPDPTSVTPEEAPLSQEDSVIKITVVEEVAVIEEKQVDDLNLKPKREIVKAQLPNWVISQYLIDRETRVGFVYSN